MADRVWTVRKVELTFDDRAVVTVDDENISLCSDRGDGNPAGYDHMTAAEARHLALTLLTAAMQLEGQG